MFDFHEKRKIRSFLYSKTVFVLLLLLTILLSISAYNRFTVAKETKERLDERRTDLEALEMRADVLDAKVQYLENDRGVEEELRNRFDVAREGEQVIIILDDKPILKQGESIDVSTDENEDSSMLGSLFEFFKP